LWADKLFVAAEKAHIQQERLVLKPMRKNVPLNLDFSNPSTGGKKIQVVSPDKHEVSFRVIATWPIGRRNTNCNLLVSHDTLHAAIYELR
jgi:hypothetical protein